MSDAANLPGQPAENDGGSEPAKPKVRPELPVADLSHSKRSRSRREGGQRGAPEGAHADPEHISGWEGGIRDRCVHGRRVESLWAHGVTGMGVQELLSHPQFCSGSPHRGF